MSDLTHGRAMAETQLEAPRPGVGKSLLIVLPMWLLSLVMLSGGAFSTDPFRVIPLGVTYVFINILFFLMVRTGKTDPYRTVLFVTYAVCFIISFITNLLELRGNMAFTSSNILRGEIPFCHMVIPMTIIPAALTRTIIFPGSLVEGFASIGTMIVIWLGVSLALGRGFCSWGCFYGGLEDGFSRCRKKAVLKKIDPKWRYLPYAVLLGIVLISALTLSPTYCEWLCPFKTVTEFAAVTSWLILIQTVIFVVLFVGLVVVLPILTRKRTQCSLLCPMGAFQSFTNKVAPFEIRVDKEKCANCNLCTRICPVFGIDEASIAKGKTNLSCIKCGKCADECPQQAISFHVKGTPLHEKRNRARLFFLYPAVLLLATMGGGMMQGALYRMMLLITTGKMIP
jgi:polyferredoxin